MKNFKLSRYLFLSAAFAMAFRLIACSGEKNFKSTESSSKVSKITWPKNLPVYDHIVIVIEENKDYDHIIGSEYAPYINNTLKAEGANLTQAYGEEHRSQGNYFWLFSGSNQNIGFKNEIPSQSTHPIYPFITSNLGEQLINNGYSFKGYSEDLPSIGSTVNKKGSYARKHVPWISFENVPNGSSVKNSSNLTFTEFPSDYNKLPTVSIVIPNLDNDMHDGESLQDKIQTGDTWLEENFDNYYQWAKENNSLLILTFDEDTGGRRALTDPSDPNNQNRIVTIFAGAHIKPGDYKEGKGITHVNMLRTIEAMYGLEKSGAQQSFAKKAGITDDYIITDIFENS